MQLLEAPFGDFAYFVARMMLSGLLTIAMIGSVRFARQSFRDHLQWRLASAGGLLLAAATALSAYDAIDNILLRPHEPVLLASWLWLFLFDLPLPFYGILLIATRRELNRVHAELVRLNLTDALTGALNRRGFLERATASIAQAQRSGLPITIAMFDIDGFKMINDIHGHGVGDEVLCSVVQALSSGTRPGDLLGRVGGEEFAVLLYDCALPAGISIADRLRVYVRTAVAHPAGAGKMVTVSGGAALADAAFHPETALSQALTKADDALYAAKRGGRDRMVGFPVPIAVSSAHPQSAESLAAPS